METGKPETLINLMRTDRTYATYENALKALEKTVEKLGAQSVPFVIAATPNGRFAPVVVGARLTLFAHHGVTVVG